MIKKDLYKRSKGKDRTFLNSVSNIKQILWLIQIFLEHFFMNKNCFIILKTKQKIRLPD